MKNPGPKGVTGVGPKGVTGVGPKGVTGVRPKGVATMNPILPGVWGPPGVCGSSIGGGPMGTA